MECIILDENMIKIVESVLAVTAFLYKCNPPPPPPPPFRRRVSCDTKYPCKDNSSNQHNYLVQYDHCPNDFF